MSNISEEDEFDTLALQKAFNGDPGSMDGVAPAAKKKRNLPGNPDPSAEVIALSPRTLMATNRFVCEVCNKGFQRDQNLQLHRRGHNLPWKLKQRSTTEVRNRVYVCPEVSCVHHDPSRALGDLTGIKKHFSRKHGEKKWKCERCSKKYAVQSDWKAHSKVCGTREYRCDCGTIFSRKDSFVTHRAFCDALAEENNKVNQGLVAIATPEQITTSILSSNSGFDMQNVLNLTGSDQNLRYPTKSLSLNSSGSMFSSNSDTVFSPSDSNFGAFSGSNNTHVIPVSAYMSATALLQKAAEMGSKVSSNSSSISPIILRGYTGYSPIMRPCGSMQEDLSHDPTDSSSQCFNESSLIRNVGTVSANSGFYTGDQNGFPKNFQGGNSDLNQCSTVMQSGFLDSSMFIQSENQANLLGGVFMELQRGAQQGIAEGDGEKMTVDFLGLGPTGRLDAMEKPMWNF